MKKLFLTISIFSILILLASCSTSLLNNEDVVVEDTSSDLENTVETIALPDIDEENMTVDLTQIDDTITFSNESITSTNDLVSIDDTTVTLTTNGTYTLTGTSLQATIYIDASSEDVITLILNNVDLSSSTGPIIYIENADKVILHIKENTTNTLTDLSSSEYDKDAMIYSKDDLTINGLGTLTIDAGLQKGIKVNDDFIVYQTTLNIESEGHAIKVNNSIILEDITLNISSKSDGIQSDNDEDITKSLIYLVSGTYNITSFGDAISSAYDMTIYDGTYTLTSGYLNTNTDDTSAKSIKADHNIYLIDGIYNITSSEDAIHSDDGLIIFDGQYTIDASDDAIHADQSLVIQDGTFDIIESYEAIEAKYIDINGGTFNIVALDDAINASDPDISSEAADVPNGGTASSSTSTAVLTITDGTFYITADDDAIDANGTLTISGGTFYINGPTSGMQSLLDYDIEFILTGGTFVGVAGYGNETKYPSTDSTQVSITYNTESIQQSGSTIALLDDQNEVLLSFTTSRVYQVIFLTSSDLEEGSTYTLTINGVVEDTFTLDEITNTFNVSSSSMTPGLPPKR